MTMKTLEKQRFKELSHGECAGAPILRPLWDRFDFSLLLTQSGIMKRNGTPSWLLCVSIRHWIGFKLLFRYPDSEHS